MIFSGGIRVYESVFAAGLISVRPTKYKPEPNLSFFLTRVYYSAQNVRTDGH